MTKKEETNDIVQNLYEALSEVGIDKVYCKQDVTTQSSLLERGDIWISLTEYTKKNFEKDIICLIEAKHKKCVIGDAEWLDAMKQGKSKATKQGLPYYAVTNCKDLVRFYNASNDNEITIDGDVITKLQPVKILLKALAQINEDNSDILNKTKIDRVTTEKDFQKSLYKLKEIYRACAIKNSEDKINTTVSFIILKYIAEMEQEDRNFIGPVKLWSDYGPNFKSDINGFINDIVNPEYGTFYADFKGMIEISDRLTNSYYAKIHAELDKYHFHGCGFDIYGAIYEEFASKKEKKEFGEYYTRRHITKVISELLLRNELYPRDIKVCDPACGTGGFLTEAFKVLIDNYRSSGSLNDDTSKKLKTDVFYGYDNQPDSIQRTILNMFLAGDGHTHITDKDSLSDLEEDTFDYVVANPPYGLYEGDVPINLFDFTNQRRFELLFVEKIIKATKHGGHMAIVVPDGALETPTNEEFRKKLLQHANINAIVSLTRFAFAPYTKEKTYVLFMQRKQREDIGKVQTTPIWHFILDNDGYANSDKRFYTPKHNDIPLLKQSFMEAEIEGKSKFVPIADVNDSNFHNLLSEYHLRPITIQSKTIGEFNDSFDGLTGKLNALITRANEIREAIKNNHTIKSVDIVERDVPLSKALKLLPKNSGITEEFIYLNEAPEKPQIPIYTSSLAVLGHLPEDITKDGKPLAINEGASVIVFRKGKAGTMFYVDDERYIACENAIPFQVSDEYEKKVLLKWFYFTYRKIFLNLVTSKADNATFNLEFLDRLFIDIPRPEIQARVIEKYEMLEDLEKDIDEVMKTLKDIEFSSIKEDV